MRTDRDSFESFNFQVPSRQKDAKPAVRSESIFAPQLFMQVVAGTSTDGYSGDTGPATLAQLRAFIPWVDTNGNIFIPDRDNFRIRRVIPSGIITTFGGTGTQSSTGTSGPISSVSFFNPFSIVGDMGGTVLYISDMLYVWKYSVSSNIVTVFAQSTTLGVGFSGDNGPARSAQLQNPRGLWLTSSGELFIADKNNHRIRSVSSTGIIRTVAGSGSPAAGGFSGDTGPALLASLSSPGGVYVDSSGILFIADCDNNRIRVVAVNNIITTFAGTGVDSPYNNDNIPALSANMLPHDVKGDSMGNIYLADWGNCVIRMIAKSDSIISTLFGTPGSCGFSAGLTGRSAVISGPRGIWVDSASTIYFSDYISIHRGVTVSAPSSQPTTQPSAQPSRQPSRQPTSSPTEHLRLYNNVFMQLVAGTNTSGYSGDNSPATSARIKSVIPWVDTSGNIYIPDGENYRIRKVNSAGIITTFGGTGVGSSAGTSGPIGSTSFGQLWCIVGDTGGTALYISDLRYVWKYVFSTNVATVFAHGTNLALGFSGDNSLASVAQLYYPEGIWLTTSGDLYIADYGNHRIRKVSAGIITTVAGSGCDSDCTGSFSGDNGPATSATLNHPRSVYVASNSHFFIADLHNHRVRVVNANNIIITFAGSGSASPFNGDYIPKESTNLNGIQDVKGDSLGNIYITESNNCIIRVVVIGIISTLFGTPGSCAFTPGTSSRSASIKSPFGICLDTLSRIYVSDTNSIHRSFSVSSPTSQPSSQPSRQPTSQPTTQPTRQPSSSPTSHRTDMSCETFQSINGWTKPSRIACNVNTASGYYWKVTLKVGEYGTSGFCSSGVYPGCNSTAIGTSGQTYSWKDWDVPWFEVSTNWCRRPSGGGCGCPADGPISSCPSDDITVFCGRYSAVCTAIPASAVIPSSQPSRQPSSRPSQQPSSQPSRKPTAQPSRQPSSQPTRQPTIQIPLTLRTSLVAYYPFDGNANDNSGNGNHGVVHGGVSLATDRFGNPRNAYSFNGISGYIEIPGTQFNFESTMSVVMWISASNNQSTFAGVFDKSYSQTAQGWGGWLIERNPNGGCSGCYMLYYPIAPTGTDAFNTPSVKLSTNVWNHFAVTKNNNVTSAFLNGVLIHKVSGASPMKSNQNLPLIIGAQNSGRTSPASSLSSFFPGFIDDIFIYNRSLSATEIQSIFNFDNPTSQPSRQPTAQPSRQPSSQPTRQPTIQLPLSLRTSLVAYYPFDGNANDNSENGNHGVVHGGVSLVSDRFGNTRNAYSFDGSSGYIEVKGGSQLNLITNITISFWMNPGSNQVNFSSILSRYHANGGLVIRQDWYLLNSYHATFYNLQQRRSLWDFKVNPNVWSHVAVVKLGSSIKFYVNRMLWNAFQDVANVVVAQNVNLPLMIGAHNGGYSIPASSLIYFFNGTLDDIAIFNRSLSAAEIFMLNQFELPTGQPSTQPTRQPISVPSSQPSRQPSVQPTAQPTRLPTVQIPPFIRTGLIAYFPFDGNADDNSGNGNHGVVRGGVSLVADRFGNARNAFSYDGSSGYIEVKGGPQLTLGTNITISFWMNPGSYQGNYTRLFSNYGGGFLIAQNKNLQGSYYVEFYSFQKQYALWNFRVTLNVWNHVVVMKIENMIRFYVNGIMQLTGHNVFNWVYTPNINLPLIIGAGSSSSAFFNGALDDIAIFNRSLSTAEILMLNQFELPTGQPSTQPTRQPIPVPTSQPSRQPTSQPSGQPTLQPTSFISETLNQGLVAYYSFDGNARDESGNGNNGQVHNTFLASDRFGNSNQAYRFDGISSYIEVAHGNAFNLGKNFSLSLWVNPASVQRVAYAFIISKSHYPGGWGVEHHISSQDNHTDFFNYRVPTVSSFPCVFHIIDNTWNHFVITRSGVTTKCYVNNVLKATETAPSLTPIVPNGNLPLTFGGCNGARTAPASGMDQFFSGILDDIFIYNRTLTLEEISRLSQFGAPTSQPSSRPSRQPSARPSNQPTRQPSCQPNARPTSQPSSQPTVCPSSQPTRRPSCQPNPFPTGIPTLQPTGCPSNQPSSQPSFHPSCVPTTLPFSFPSGFPTNQPTGIPSLSPSSSPSSQPTRVPTIYPTSVPSIQPSSYPSSQPTSFPSNYPICILTLEPTGHPTRQPSSLPTSLHSEQPSSQPSTYPTGQPSSHPSVLPSIYPTNTPTRFPSATPSSLPSLRPSTQPSSFPSLLPTGQPSSQPSSKPSCVPFSAPSLQPTCRPSSRPSNDPTHLPTAKPSRQPSSQPTMQPSRRPSGQPTCKPSKQPSTQPSSQPSGSPISSFPTSEPTITTESPTPLRNPSISAYPSQTRRPTRQPITPRPTAIPTVRPSFIPTSAPTHTVSVFPSGNIDFKESLFFFGSYLPTLENIPNIYLTGETIGSSYIIFGFQQKEGRPKEINLGSRSSHGLYSQVMNNEAGLMQDRTMSRSVLPVGDFNGDTYKDLLICDPVNSICFVYCGHVNGLENLRVSFAIKSDSNNLFGWSIAKMNDLNRDNLDDFAISALSSNVIYVFFGSKFTTDIIVDEQLDSSIGITIIGSQNDQNTGLALTSAGDFNNDGYSDILFSAIQISPYQDVIYILFFNSNIMKQNIIMDTLTINKDYLKITAPLFCFAGFSLSNLGDINQDGFDDVIIGSIPYSGRYLTQKSYVVYGRNVSSPFSLTEMREEDGFTITGGGFMVGGPGDVNGDGIPDIMVSSYQQWQGKWNSYIMVYPRNITSPPTFLPSSQPTSSPSLSPTSLPSIKVQDPTSAPTLQETTNEPVSEGTFPPFLGATQLPSLAPKTSKPTRVPSMKLTTHFPTVKTDLPSASPTRQPTESPTRRPTILPSTHRPSRYPTRQPISSVFPTSSPSRLSTESLSTNIKEIIIEKDGIYQLPGGEVNCVISGAGDFQITSYGDGKKIYTILPSKNTITITNFNRRYDHISLIHFPYLYSTKSLTYRTHPLQIILSNEQRLVLSSLAASDLTEENFIFHKDSENQKPISVQLSFASVISLGILMSCVGLTWFLVKVNGTDEADDFLSKDTLDSDENEKVEELESQHENIFSEISSNMLSSRSDSKDNSEGDSDNLSVKERVLESADDDDWNLFSSLASFFSSDDDPVITLKSVPDITVDSEDDEEQSFLFTESEEELDGHLDIEGNYK
jgi:hypothetical protein